MATWVTQIPRKSACSSLSSGDPAIFPTMHTTPGVQLTGCGSRDMANTGLQSPGPECESSRQNLPLHGFSKRWRHHNECHAKSITCRTDGTQAQSGKKPVECNEAGSEGLLQVGK